MSMTRLAAGIGAMALTTMLSLPATAADTSHRAASAQSASAGAASATDISARKRYYRHHYVHRYYRPYAHRYYRPYGYGYYRHSWGPRYGYYSPHYYGGPRAYVSLPFVSFGFW